VGKFKNGLKDGKGTYTYSDGSVYVGEYKNDLRHGKGTFTYSDGFVESGKWEYNQFID
jgi:hypothetical protein